MSPSGLVQGAPVGPPARWALLSTLLLLIGGLQLAATQLHTTQGPPPLTFEMMFDKCPAKERLDPCVCLPASREIICNGSISNVNTIRYIFSGASQTELKFSHLVLSSSPIDTIVVRAFSPFSFAAITIVNNYYLSHFEEDAFWPSNLNADTLKFDDNPKLGYTNESVHSLFAAVRTFSRISVLVIRNCGLTFIPANAFGERGSAQLQHLRRVSLVQNPIKTIYGGAFTGLPLLRNLVLVGNKIDKIESGAFELTTVRCTAKFNYEKPYYFVDLSNNKLGPDSLATSFFYANCSADLNLSNNSLTYLPPAIFQPLFANYIKIQLFGNQLDCGDCHMAWLLKGRFCPKFNSTIHYYSLVDSACHATVHSLVAFKQKCAAFLTKQAATTLPPNGAASEAAGNTDEELFESDVDLLQCPADGPNASAQPAAHTAVLFTATLALLALQSSLFN